MKIEFRDRPVLRLHGYSPESPLAILARVAAGAKPSSLKGDFVFVAEGADAATGRPLTVFVSTVIAAVPYFFHIAGSRCVHAANVFECCEAAGLHWRWNWKTLGQLAIFEHVIGNVSLHEEISRVPQASVLKVCGGEVELVEEPFWDDLYRSGSPGGKCNEAASLLVELLSEVPAARGCSLSLSAGYDSRVLLACLVHLNRPVAAASMGAENSTDPRIARELAQRVGCEFRRVEIQPDDYVRSAREIVTATSGEKIFCHWHTGIFARQAGFDAGAFHLAGSNGEFARSYFFDKGFVAELLDASCFPRWDWWLALKYSARRRVAPGLWAAIENGLMLHQALDAGQHLKQTFLAGLRFGDGLERFYASVRVRNFIGLGLALYRSCFPTMSPFLDARFIRYAQSLRRHDKLANRMHRTVIGQLQPELLEFPTDESGVPMRSDPGALYFLARSSVSAYQRDRDALQLPQIKQWAHRGFRELGGTVAESEIALRTQVERWSFAITVGAVLNVLEAMGIQRR